MRKIIADRIFPISTKPMKEAMLVVGDDGQIVDLVAKGDVAYSTEGAEIYAGYLCPGFVNTHCHLELSYLRNMIKPGGGLVDFILQVEKAKNNISNNSIRFENMVIAEKEMIDGGIVAVGDISNTDFSFELKSNNNLYYHTFIEVYGSNPNVASYVCNQANNIFSKIVNGNQSQSSIVPHSAYSVSPTLLEMLSKHSKTSDIVSIHHLESKDEKLLFDSGKGAIADLIVDFKGDLDKIVSNFRSPIDYMRKYYSANRSIQLVHNTYCNKDDVAIAESVFSNLYWCLCPTSNLFIEKKLPDIDVFIQQGVKITVGTDSLASNIALSMLDELKIIENNFNVGLNDLFQWATINGAEFLKIDNRFGSFQTEKKPGVVLIENVDSGNDRIGGKAKAKRIA